MHSCMGFVPMTNPVSILYTGKDSHVNVCVSHVYTGCMEKSMPLPPHTQIDYDRGALEAV